MYATGLKRSRVVESSHKSLDLLGRELVDYETRRIPLHGALTVNPALAAHTPPLWPTMAADDTLPVPTRFVST